MREVSVHKDDVVASACGESLDVGTTKAEFAGTRMELQLITINLLELLYDFLGAIRRVVVHDNDLHVDIMLLCCLHEQISDNW